MATRLIKVQYHMRPLLQNSQDKVNLERVNQHKTHISPKISAFQVLQLLVTEILLIFFYI